MEMLAKTNMARYSQRRLKDNALVNQVGAMQEKLPVAVLNGVASSSNFLAGAGGTKSKT